MEENFEKKSSKTFLKVLIPLILIIALLAGGFFIYKNTKAKPENTFKSAVEKIFKAEKIKENSQSVKANFEITASLESEDTNIKAVNQYVSSAKITLNEEADLEKKIMKLNSLVDFDNEQIIDANIILQDGKIYAFAKEFFSKYVEIPEDELGIEFSQMLDEIFERAGNSSAKETNKLMKDIEKTILEFLDKQEYETSKETITIADKTVNATKTKLDLNQKQVSELLVNILKVVRDNEYIKDVMKSEELDFEEQINSAIEKLEETENDGEFLVSSVIYSNGVAGDIVKATVEIKAEDEKIAIFNYEKTEKDKKNITVEVEDSKLGLEIYKKDKNTTVYTLTLPEELEGVNVILEHFEEKDNKGQMTLKLKIPKEFLQDQGIKKDVTAKINVKYDIVENAKVEKEDVKNSIKFNEFTEADQQELMNNLQNSKLYTVFSTFIGV